jgi:hypothetical protein
MNELQIRLTADIKDLQSAINKAKATLKSFESETATDSEKSNVGFRRKIGLIEQLTAKAKALKVSLSQATNEQQIAKFNAELEQTNQELARLNSLGKSFGGTAVKSFDNLKRSAGAASGAAISFGRIIQDAPFGIIGVANNIQNFGEQFVALGGKATTAGQRLSMFFTALIQPANLAILAVSALTAAWQAYSLGLFDAKDATEDLNKELEDFKNSLDGVSKAQLEGVQSAQSEIQALKLLKLQAENANLPLEKRILAVKELRNQFPDYLKGLSDEEILLGNVGTAYNNVTTSIIAQAKAKAFSEQITENLKKEVALLVQEQQRALVISQKQLDLEEAKKNTIDAGARVAGQFTATNSDAVLIEAEINKLKKENLNSEEQRKKLGQEILFIESKIPEQIEKAGGLIDNNNDKVKQGGEKLNRVFDENILFLERFGNEVDNNKKKIESLGESLAKTLEQEQKALFETIATLRQGPANLINAVQLSLAAQRLTEIDALIGSIASKRENTELPAIDESQLVGLELPTKQDPGIIEGLEKQIETFEKLKKVTSDPTMLALYTLKIDLLKNKLAEFNGEEVKSNLQLIADAFGSMGQQIANSLNISNKSLRGFVTTLVSATPKIVAAILAKSQATNRAADSENIANAKLAAGNSVVVATEGAKGLGPVGLALLPVFIAGALALVSSAFGKAGSGGGSASAGTGSTFTNRREFGGPVSKGRAYIVGERRPELFVPNTNGVIVPQVPSMDYSGASMAAGAMAIDVNIQGVSYGDDILFTVQQAQIRRNIR